VAAIGRRVNTLCKHEAGLPQQRTLCYVCPTFVGPHASVRFPLPELDTIPETGSSKRWQLRTLARAAGLSDRLWRVSEGLIPKCVPQTNLHGDYQL
jgi:hypothetical protein